MYVYVQYCTRVYDDVPKYNTIITVLTSLVQEYTLSILSRVHYKCHVTISIELAVGKIAWRLCTGSVVLASIS